MVQMIRRARMAFALISAESRNNAIITHPNVNSPSRYCHVAQ
jgi:hypothetical protein